MESVLLLDSLDFPAWVGYPPLQDPRDIAVFGVEDINIARASLLINLSVIVGRDSDRQWRNGATWQAAPVHRNTPFMGD